MNGYNQEGQQEGGREGCKSSAANARSGVGERRKRADQKPIRKIEGGINIKGELNRFPEIENQKGVDIRGVIKLSSHSRPRTTRAYNP